jgi:AmiR/NasT family two-component response regulator
MTVVDEPSRQVVQRLQELAPGTVVADVADLQRQSEHLTVAVGTNRVIGAAVGILMERLQRDRAAAFRSADAVPLSMPTSDSV